MEWQFIYDSIVKAHQHSGGTSSNVHKEISKSVTGNSTKIHLAVDSYGLPIVFDISGGEVHDRGLITEQARKQAAIPVIPRNKTQIQI